MPLLTNHLALLRLSLRAPAQEIIPKLARLPLFAPGSLTGIWVDPWDGFTMDFLEGIPESQWKAVDLALCDPKFSHLTSVEFTNSSKAPLENPHAFFQRVLPKSYKRGILWPRRDYGSMYLIVVILPMLISIGRPIRVAPVSAPQYPGLPIEWEDFDYA